MGISADANYGLFIHVPKTGGSNFIRARRRHLTAEEFFRFFPHVSEVTAFWSIYRDPVERFESTVNYLIGGGNGLTQGVAGDLQFFDRYGVGSSTWEEQCKLCEDNLTVLMENERMFWPQSRFLYAANVFAPSKYLELGSRAFKEMLEGASVAERRNNRRVSMYTCGPDFIKVIRAAYKDDYSLVRYVIER